ncbi:MAG: SprT-like domain-containing protein [Holophagaceae bacterium]|nr:SprT-like domain-containing protein [Holophagaceae bacterium]
MSILRQLATNYIARAGWSVLPPPVVWSPRMTRSAGMFVVEKDRRGNWHPEIRLSIPLIRRRDRPWPIEVCGCFCRDSEAILTKILEHELVHYKLWMDGEADWGHTPRFKQIAWEAFGHQGIHHGIGVEA